MTEVQQAYWVGRRPGMPLGGIGAHYYCEFDRFSDVERLNQAWNVVIARHDMLRAVFGEDGSQRVLQQVPRFEVQVRTLTRSATVEEVETAFADLRAAMSHQVIDVTQWPPFDVRAIRYGDGKMRVGISLDNLILDGFSMMQLFDELARLYDGASSLGAIPSISFRDFVQQSRPDATRLGRAQDYWRSRFAALPPGPQLALALNPDDVVSPKFGRRELRLNRERWHAMKSQARRHGVTPSTVLLAAYAEVLGAWSGRKDLTLTLTLFDRGDAHPDVDKILGDFTSVLLVAYEPVAGEPWLDSVRRLQSQLWRDLDHREAPGIWVLRELARSGRRASFPVVFTSVIGLASDIVDTLPWPEWSISQTPQVWLDHQVIERDGGAILTWDAVEAVFPADAIDEAFLSYQSVLEWAATSDWAQPPPALKLSAERGVEVVSPTVATVSPDDATGVPPNGDLELALAEVWRDLLGAEVRGRDQNFFTLGGDSLLATRFAQTVLRRFGVELSLREFFANPTIAAVGAAVACAQGRGQSRFAARVTSQQDSELMEDGIL
jgi:aryl carrier-like protein